MPVGTRQRRVWILTQNVALAEQVAETAAAQAISSRNVALSEIGELDAHGGVLVVDTDLDPLSTRRCVAVAKDQFGDAWYICGIGHNLNAETFRTLREAGADHVVQGNELRDGLTRLFLALYPE